MYLPNVSCLCQAKSQLYHRGLVGKGSGLIIINNNNLNIFMQDCCFSFKKKTAINAGPVKN